MTIFTFFIPFENSTCILSMGLMYRSVTDNIHSWQFKTNQSLKSLTSSWLGFDLKVIFFSTI